MRPQALLLVVLVLGSGLLAGVLAYSYLTKEGPEGQPVIVAAVPIPIGQVVTKEMIKEEKFPKDIPLPEDKIEKAEDVLGKAVSYRVNAGQYLTKSALADKGGIASQIPNEGDWRAITVPVSTDRALHGFLSMGSVVDVFWSPRIRNEVQMVRTLLQQVKVLAVNQEFMTDEKGSSKGKQVETVTLLVTHEQAEKLKAAMDNGSLSLVLRNPGDSTVVKSRGVTIQELLSGKAEVARNDSEAPAEVKQEPPPSVYSVFTQTLTKLAGEKAPEPQPEPEATKTAQEPATKETAEPVPVGPPPKKLKRLRYPRNPRNPDGEILMEVLFDPDSKWTETPGIIDMLEDSDKTVSGGVIEKTAPAPKASPKAPPKAEKSSTPVKK